MTENRCVICGAIIPEGIEVCPICEDAYLKVREYIDTVKAKYKEAEERIKTMSEYKRLTKRTDLGYAYCEEPHFDSLNRLAELEDKIENGTLIRLPIPYGTELHFLYSRETWGIPQPPCVFSTNEWQYHIRYDCKKWFSVVGRGIGYFGEFLHELGKTVFLTKVEAEQRLKELEVEV